MDDVNTLLSRERLARVSRERLGSLRYPPGYPSVVGQVYAISSVPTSANVFVAVHPTDVIGTESEGSPGVIAVNTFATIFVYIIGAPAQSGDLVLCRWLGNRWAAERMGTSGSSGGGVTIIGCPCTNIPATLHLHSSAPLSNNQIFQNATLQYGPTPVGLMPVVIQTYSYLSTTSFFDPIMGTSFYYFLTCIFGTYVLTRVYPISPLGSPFRDSIRYSWLPGFPGNSCVPFLMANGQIFQGGNATCVVTLSA